MSNPQLQAGVIPEWTLTDRLRKAREITGLDQTQFANAIEVSRTTVNNYEQGHVSPRRIVMRAWALRSGVSLEWLLNDETPPAEAEDVPVKVHPPGLEPGTHWLRDNVTYLGVAA